MSMILYCRQRSWLYVLALYYLPGCKLYSGITWDEKNEIIPIKIEESRQNSKTIDVGDLPLFQILCKLGFRVPQVDKNFHIFGTDTVANFIATT
jgi:hypothetical protein